LIDWLADLAGRTGRRLPLRLVKGAYWDTEVKRSQEQGLIGYPVFTRKPSTDVSYIACAAKLLAKPDAFYPQFATHNAQTLATILAIAEGRQDFEFQRLHGMGEALYERIVGNNELGLTCRVYAPVGSHEHLLAYLVRRLLENGANTSFVNRIVDDSMPIDEMIGDPADEVRAAEPKPHPKIPLPMDLFGPDRRNSKGLDLSDRDVLRRLAGDMAEAAAAPFHAAPIIGGAAQDGPARPITDPADRRREVGSVIEASDAQVEAALAAASGAAPGWSATPAEERARCLERAADLLEEHMAEAMAIATREAGKTLVDGVAEVREAVDFCRYYAQRARLDFGAPVDLPGPTGERNVIELHGRGVFLCISPWNFPLAIFTGQVAAALAAGNAVLAKPAEQTSAMGAFAVRLMHEAGVPGDVLHLLPGDGARIGGRLIGDERVSGVAFTGSTDVAHLINRGLAARSGPIVPLIAETGGQNAMIVDSTALPEQVAADVIRSAVNSAGQRCSALRVLFVQDDVADRMLTMLAGAMAELRIGDPGLVATDVGPVIDDEAKATLEAHAERMDSEAKFLFCAELPDACAHGTFFAPRAYEIDGIGALEREVFGPILHVVRYDAARLDRVVDAINATGYGLTLGIHTRIDETARFVAERARVGNVYVNRNMIGAIVGSQPFGGEGLSGTGPKAGGPRYLHRFATERVISTDTTAAGGNAALMSLGED
jgi:RHH-type proline utilization regulon transcriptional repressor/proline dehydrogenase/delta 1-pyrroline-5-carboxylate dehydrogenase